MLFIIGVLTAIMVLDCVVLAFLVLIQLPKKEAGAGLAFGGAATDALFGAGSGNILTKITKYAAGLFFFLAIVLSAMQMRYHGGAQRSTSGFLKEVQQPSRPVMPAPSRPVTPAPTASTNTPVAPAAEATNLSAPSTPAAAPTNQP
jgi:preprotein translocase subunit SecG